MSGCSCCGVQAGSCFCGVNRLEPLEKRVKHLEDRERGLLGLIKRLKDSRKD